MSDKLQSLLNLYSSATEDSSPADAPKFLAELTVEDLAAMDAAACDAFGDIRKSPTFGIGDADRLETITVATEAIRAEAKRREESTATIAQRVDSLTERMLGVNAGDGDTKSTDGPAGGTATEGGDGGAAAPAAAPAEPEAAVEGEIVPAGKELVTASGSGLARVDLASVKARQAETTAASRQVTNMQTGVCVASADVPGFGTGWTIRTDAELARAITGRFAGMPLGSENVGPISAGIAQYERRMPSELVASSKRTLDEALGYACDEKALPGGSLTAAVNCGWCAPPERDWTLCTPLESLDGMLELPAVTVGRGGLEFTTQDAFWQIFDQVPDQVLAPPGYVCKKSDGTDCEPPLPCPPDKTCISIPCPEWDKCIPRLSVLCIEAPILMREAWPEALAQFVGRVRTAYRRNANRRYLTEIATKVLAAQGGVPYAAPASIGAAGRTFDAISLQATWYRELNRMGRDATLMVIAPMWLRAVLKADLAKRDGCGCEAITNARLDEEFAELNVRVNWVYDWQDLAKIAPAVPGPRAPIPVTTWPNTVDLLMFPFGTFALALSNVITLNAVYDSTNLKKNVYTELFMEDKFCLIQRCYDAMLIRVPLCVGGGTGPRVDLCEQSPVSQVVALPACPEGQEYTCTPVEPALAVASASTTTSKTASK